MKDKRKHVSQPSSQSKYIHPGVSPSSGKRLMKRVDVAVDAEVAVTLKRLVKRRCANVYFNNKIPCIKNIAQCTVHKMDPHA